MSDQVNDCGRNIKLPDRCVCRFGSAAFWLEGLEQQQAEASKLQSKWGDCVRGTVFKAMTEGLTMAPLEAFGVVDSVDGAGGSGRNRDNGNLWTWTRKWWESGAVTVISVGPDAIEKEKTTP